MAQGDAAHVEGYHTAASGDASHAEGGGSRAFGLYAHAEGQDTTAASAASHAEGYTTIAEGPYSHAEGQETQAKGHGSHAEGFKSESDASASHAEGDSTAARGNASHAEGGFTLAEGDYSHSEGFESAAKGFASHAEGDTTTAAGAYSHAEGSGTTAKGDASHAQGEGTHAQGKASHAEGKGTSAHQLAAHAEGIQTVASGVGARAEGYQTTASGHLSTAGGKKTNTSKLSGASIVGKFGNALESYAWHLANGIDEANPGLAAKINQSGEAAIDRAWLAGGQHYAEMFETANKEAIDYGFFVTFEGTEGKIRKAGKDDRYILGITSKSPSLIGNAMELRWSQKYVTDEWGGIRYQQVTVPPLYDRTGSLIEPGHVEDQPVLNPKWNPKQPYLPRRLRPEWAAVSLLGQVLIRDDGSCVPGRSCRPSAAGVATNAADGYRVMTRTGKNQVLILFR
ncbi:peptidase G2 autoproteolytic cleavage domain-containing protein [Paenibacillus solisilvae]|uniref:Peptidase G2 autoproteolytic cleavage domain-containing protein n=1 Tax=Paenibacillus solisilvae TaxID=2486751 RepID=A0ABW0W7R1_9BACL